MHHFQSPLDQVKRIQAARDIFQSVLGSALPSQIFDSQRVTFSEDGRRMYEYTSSRDLAEAVFQADFPRFTAAIELNHFASFHGFQGIVRAGSLFLTSLTKRLHEDEFTTFMKEHGLDGYKEADPDTGRPIYETLSKDIFYCSMTEPNNPDENELWDVFADRGKGVRLHLRVTPKAADLRKMAYKGTSPTALKQINDKLLAQEQLTYTPWTLSRICAFYLTPGYGNEREIRLMIKRHHGGPDPTRSHNGFDVWPVPLAALGSTTGDNWCEIELLDVTAGSRCLVSSVQSVLAGTAYQAAPISKKP